MSRKDIHTNKIYQTIILIVLALFIVSKPIIKSLADITDSKTEVFETSEEENSEEESEEIEDFEDEKLEFYSLLKFNAKSYSEQYTLLYNVYKHVSEYNPNVLIPPPKHTIIS